MLVRIIINTNDKYFFFLWIHPLVFKLWSARDCEKFQNSSWIGGEIWGRYKNIDCITGFAVPHNI